MGQADKNTKGRGRRRVDGGEEEGGGVGGGGLHCMKEAVDKCS